MRPLCYVALFACMLLSPESFAQQNPPLLTPQEEAPRHYPLSVFLQIPWGHWLFGKKIPAETTSEFTSETHNLRRRSFPLSVGIRGDIVILNNGFSATYDEQFGLSLGLDVGSLSGGLWVATPAEFWWRLFLRYRLAFYAKLGAGTGWTIVSHQEKTYFEVFPIASLGFEYRFSHILSFRLEAGFPCARMGLAF